jgi:hypothetical protein
MATSHGGTRRINTTAAGYGWSHQQARRQVAPAVLAGLAVCARCGLPIAPWEAWHLDHADDRRGYVGVSHARCNTSAGARKGNRMRRERLSDEARAIAWARQYEADMARLERERQQAEPVERERRPRSPAIY